MSPAHAHIVLAHMPIIGIFFGLVLLAFAKSNVQMFRAAMIVFTIAGLTGVVVYLLGEPTEEIVEDMAGISHDLIKHHEEVGLYAMLSGIALSLVSLVGLVLSRRARPKWFLPVALVVALFAGSVFAITANRGGQINHPEIRTTAPGEPLLDHTHEHDDD